MKNNAKRLCTIVSLIGLLCSTVIVVYAISRLFFSQNVISNFRKKQIFEFDLTTSSMVSEVGPGDSVSVNPVIMNNATEKMYVFIEVRFPLYESAELYEYNIDENWVLVESSDGDMVFAYAEDGMTVLSPGESTTALMSTITMKHISNAEYAEIDNINISITGYAIDCESYSTVPTEVWSEIKMMK